MMNVRRMTMLPVDEMRKLSQMVGIEDADLEIPATEAGEPKEGEPKAEGEEPKVEEASAEATVTVAPPAEPAPEAEKKE